MKWRIWTHDCTIERAKWATVLFPKLEIIFIIFLRWAFHIFIYCCIFRNYDRHENVPWYKDVLMAIEPCTSVAGRDLSTYWATITSSTWELFIDLNHHKKIKGWWIFRKKFQKFLTGKIFLEFVQPFNLKFNSIFIQLGPKMADPHRQFTTTTKAIWRF